MSDASGARLIALDVSAVVPETSVPDAGRIISGEPVHCTWNIEDDGQGLYAGIWESTPGAWRIAYTEWEFCHILTGISELTEDGGETRTYRAGDSFLIRPGFKGIWSVVETTRKHYVVKA